MKTYKAKNVTISIDSKELKGFSIPSEAVSDFCTEPIVITDKVLEKTKAFIERDGLTFRQALLKATDKVVFLYADKSEVE